jgi:hypothetical protein
VTHPFGDIEWCIIMEFGSACMDYFWRWGMALDDVTNFFCAVWSVLALGEGGKERNWT